jgi:hypothetical protein
MADKILAQDPLPALVDADAIDKACAFFGGPEERILRFLLDNPEVVRKGLGGAAIAATAKRLRMSTMEVEQALGRVRRFLRGEIVMTRGSLRNALIRNDRAALGEMFLFIAVGVARRYAPENQWDDAVGEAILAMVRASRGYDRQRDAFAWCNKVAANAIRDMIRGETRHRKKLARVASEMIRRARREGISE